MATSFTAAALGAEGLAADVTMLIGNGYVPGHADYALQLLRDDPRRRRAVPRPALSSRRRRGTRRSPAQRPVSGGTAITSLHHPELSAGGPVSRPRPLLDLDPAAVRRARALARRVGRPIVRLAEQHTTVSVERATLRMAGLSGADPDGTPWANRLLDTVRADVGLEHGVSLPVWDALVRGEAGDLTELAQKAAVGSVRFRLPEGRDAHPRAPRRRSGRSGRGCAASTAAGASGSGWSSASVTRSRPRGST